MFVLVVVGVDLMIVILFLVCRVAQKQLLDAILIIVTKRFYRVVFDSRPSYKRVVLSGKERKKKEEREK